jgi:hypothetical protein
MIHAPAHESQYRLIEALIGTEKEAADVRGISVRTCVPILRYRAGHCIMMPPSFSSEYVRARRSSRRRSTRRAIPRPISLAAASRLALIRATRPTPAASWANASTGRCCSTRRPRSSCAPSLSLDFMKPAPHARLDRKSASCSPSHRTMCWSLLGARAAAVQHRISQ